MTGLGELNGTVTHATLGVPVSGATVTVVGANRSFTTNAAGEYSGFVPGGTFNVTASHPSFQSETVNGVTIIVGDEVTVDFALDGAADGIDPVVTDVTCLFATDDTAGPYVIGATVTDNQGFIVVRLHYQVNSGGYVVVPMTPGGPNRYQGSIPGTAPRQLRRLLRRGVDAALNSVTDPPSAPGVPYNFAVATPTSFSPTTRRSTAAGR